MSASLFIESLFYIFVCNLCTEKLAGAVLNNMIDSVCLLLASKTREIIKTALGFVKVLLSAYENTVLAAHLKDLVWHCFLSYFVNHSAFFPTLS